jgi:hypothetical protein
LNFFRTTTYAVALTSVAVTTLTPRLSHTTATRQLPSQQYNPPHHRTMATTTLRRCHGKKKVATCPGLLTAADRALVESIQVAGCRCGGGGGGGGSGGDDGSGSGGGNDDCRVIMALMAVVVMLVPMMVAVVLGGAVMRMVVDV